MPLRLSSPRHPQVDRLQAERRDLQQGLARERHAAGATTAELQRQLKAARDRVASMVGALVGPHLSVVELP